MKANTDSVGIRDLSRRETEIVSLAASGMTDKEIGLRLGISYGTVNTHWSRIRPKMNVANRSEAVSRYVRAKANREYGELASENMRLADELQRRSANGGDSRLARVIADAVPLLIAILDFAHPGSVWLNESARKAVGLLSDPASTLSFARARTILHPADRGQFMISVQAARSGAGPAAVKMTLRIGAKDRIWRTTSAKFLVSGEAAGEEPTHVVVVAQENASLGSRTIDLDCRRDSIQEAVDEMREVVDDVPTGLMLIDPSGRVLQACPVAKCIWGATDDVKNPMQMRDPFSGRPLAEHDWPQAKALNGHTVRLQIVDIVRSDGDRRRVLCTATPVRDHEGGLVAAALVLADLTRGRRSE